jgi:hypothetical protein
MVKQSVNSVFAAPVIFTWIYIAQIKNPGLIEAGTFSYILI